MVFHIKDYIWNIFEIMEYQNLTNIDIALDMFLTNIELCDDRYKGAKHVKYRKVSKAWNGMGYYRKTRERAEFDKVMHKMIIPLHSFYFSKDRISFNYLCNKAFNDISKYSKESNNK